MPASSLYSASPGTNTAIGTTTKDPDHENLMAIISQTITAIVTTSKEHIGAARKPTDIDTPVPPDTELDTATDTQSVETEQETNQTIPEIVMDKELKYRHALVDHIQTFMNRLHEHQMYITMKHFQALDMGSILTKTGITSSAANIRPTGTARNTSKDTRSVIIDDKTEKPTGSHNLSLPSTSTIPGVNLPPTSVMGTYPGASSDSNYGTRTGVGYGSKYSSSDFVRNRVAEAARSRMQSQQQLNDRDYATALQMEEEEKRKYSWAEWNKRQAARMNGTSTFPNTGTNSTNYDFDSASRDSYRWTPRTDPTTADFHADQTRRWNRTTGFGIWDNHTQSPPGYSYIDRNTGNVVYPDDESNNSDSEHNIWDDVDEPGGVPANEFRLSPMERISSAYPLASTNSTSIQPKGSYRSTALEHFGEDVTSEIETMPSTPPPLDSPSSIDFQDNAEEYEDYIGYHNGQENTEQQEQSIWKKSINDHESHVSGCNEDDESASVDSYSEDEDQLETVQCCGRIGYSEHYLRAQPINFLAKYPHNVHITAQGVVVGNPCTNRIPADEFYKDQKILCNTCMTRGATNITEPAKTFAPLTHAQLDQPHTVSQQSPQLSYIS